MSDLFAAAHPGKQGDALYSLPTIRKLYEYTGMKCDFYTSDYCEPLRSLFEYQSCINAFYVAPNYKIERMDMGCQPYYVPIDRSLYNRVLQLGFQRVPDCAIHEFIGKESGVGVVDLPKYEVPSDVVLSVSDYFVIAPRGESSYKQLFLDVIRSDPSRFVVIGGSGDYLGWGVDMTGRDYLTTTAIIAKSRGFVGLMSSQLVLANGFPIPKVVPHDGRSWDMRHVIYTESHHYLVNPTVEDVLNALL